MENARSIKWILKNFEAVSGLAVNFEKCCLFGINLQPDQIQEMADSFGCLAGSFPFSYLGMKVGGPLKGAVGWAEIIDRIKRRIQSWNGKGISLGGRLTLINSVLSAIPIYRLSFAPMPVSVAKEIRTLQCNFLWGGETESKKICWIKWDRICRSKKEGGLGIKDLRCFNLALLSKWVWRMLNGKNQLWIKVIKSRHGGKACLQDGIVGGGAGGGGSQGVGWWGKILANVEGEKGELFWGKLRLELGDGLGSSFWNCIWTGENALSSKFHRLYGLCLNKKRLVGEMGSWHDDGWHWEFDWRRRLLDRETVMVSEMLNHISGANLKRGVEDTWKWTENASGTFSVKSAYKLLLEEKVKIEPSREVVRTGGFHKIWKGTATLKAKVMAWRLLWDRLPTSVNLEKKIQLGADASKCKCCLGERESAEHLFLRCNAVQSLWQNLIRWIGVEWVAPKSLQEHFCSFAALLGGGKMRKKLGDLWICVVWVIWYWRNEFHFKGRPWNFCRIEDEIKSRFWSWLTIRSAVLLSIPFSVWRSNPLYVTLLEC